MKNILLFLSFILICSCSSDDTEPFTLANKNYKVVAFKTETNMDLNGDGVFSTDLLSELDADRSALLSQMRMRFDPDGKVSYPYYDFPAFNVIEGEQISWTQALSSTTIPYVFNNPSIRVLFGNTVVSGELSNDGQTIVTSYDPNVLLEGLSYTGNFINESGEVETYTGNFIITLELQN